MGTPDSLDALIAAALRSADAHAAERETPPPERAPAVPPKVPPALPSESTAPIEALRRRVSEATRAPSRPAPPFTPNAQPPTPKPAPPLARPVPSAATTTSQPAPAPKVRKYPLPSVSITQLLRDHRVGAAKTLLEETLEGQRFLLIQEVINFFKAKFVVLATEGVAAAENRFQEARYLITVFENFIPLDSFKRALQSALAELLRNRTVINEDDIETIISSAENAFKDILRPAPRAKAPQPQVRKAEPAAPASSKPEKLLPAAQRFEDLLLDGEFDEAQALAVDEETRKKIVLGVFRRHIGLGISELQETNGRLDKANPLYSARKLFLARESFGVDERSFADAIRLLLIKLRLARNVSHLLHSKISDAVATVFDAKLNW